MTFDEVTKRERTLSGALALAMHVLFFILLVVGVSWQPKRTASPVVVDLWSELPAPPQPKAEPPPPPPEPKPAPRPPRPEPRPEPEPKPVPKPDIALKEQLAKERKRKEIEEQKKKEEAKKIAEQKKREEEKKKVAEKQKREAEEKKRLAALKEKEDAKRREEELQAMLRKQELQAAEAAAQAKLDAYKRSVSEKIKRYIVLPPNIQGNPEAQFEVVQIPGGEILTVKLKRSSGNAAYDAAVERAIHKAQPLPPPPDPARFSEVRELELRFRPKE